MAEEQWLNDYVFTVAKFLSPSECKTYIQLSEDIGFEPATVSSPDGQVLAPRIRNNQRVTLRNPDMASELWERIQDFVPMEFDGRRAVGVNDLFRIYKYEPGQRFNWHQDFPVQLDDDTESVYTFMIYLNEDFSGGATSFEDSYSDDAFDELSIVPETGMALLFEHPTHHIGEEVTEGIKYVLRSDIFYASEWQDHQEEDEDELFEDD